MDEEQAVRVVSSFNFSEARVVASPVRLLPSLLEVIALAHVRSRFPCDSSKLIHASIDALRSFPSCRNRRLVTWNSRISGSLAVGHDRQSEGRQNGWIHCGVLRRGERVGQPQRLVTPNEPGAPTRVSLPPRVIGSRAGPMVEVQNRLKQVCEGIVKEPDQGIAIWIRKSDFRPMLLPHKEHDDTAKVTVGKLAATIVPNAERWREHTSPARSKTALVNAGANAARCNRSE